MSPASANATERPTPLPIPITIRLIALLKAIGEARDGMLVLIAGVYILGFFSWAIYSLQENIGFIRIFDAQYFVAGILPAISIAFIVLGWTLWRILWPPLRLMAAILVYVLFFLIFLNGAFEFLPISVPHHPSWGTAFLIFAAGLFFIPLLLIGSREALRQKPLENVGWLGAVYNEILSYKYFVAGFGYLAIFLFLLGMFGLYVGIIYPGLPQEFGGPRARCADVILDPRALSKQAWEQFGVTLTTTSAESSGADKPSGIASTQSEPTHFLKRAQVLYSDDKAVIFRPDGSDPKSGSIEIRKDLVRALVWCRE